MIRQDYKTFNNKLQDNTRKDKIVKHETIQNKIWQDYKTFNKITKYLTIQHKIRQDYETENNKTW